MNLDNTRVAGVYTVTVKDAEGQVKYTEEVPNKVMETGMHHMLDVTLRNQTQISAWYVGLFNNNVASVDETWTSSNLGTEVVEYQSYTPATRPQYSPAAAATKAISNSASRASFTVSSNDTIYGMFLIDSSTKGGTSGTMFSVGTFSTPATVTNGDTIEVTYTLTLANQ